MIYPIALEYETMKRLLHMLWNMDHGGVFISVRSVQEIQNSVRTILASRKSGVGFDDFQKCFVVRISWGEDRGDMGYFCSLRSTFAIHNWHETLGPSTGSKISRRLRQRESKSQSFFVVVNPEGLRPTYTMLNTSTFRHAHQENVWDMWDWHHFRVLKRQVLLVLCSKLPWPCGCVAKLPRLQEMP